MAQPTKLTPEAHRAICKAVAGGVSRQVAAAAAGVHPRTFQRWLSAGRRELAEGRAGDYATLAEGVALAEARAHRRAVGIIRKAMRTTWQAAAWWLERRYPEDWSDHRKEIRELQRAVRELTELTEGQRPGGATRR